VSAPAVDSGTILLPRLFERAQVGIQRVDYLGVDGDFRRGSVSKLKILVIPVRAGGRTEEHVFHAAHRARQAGNFALQPGTRSQTALGFARRYWLSLRSPRPGGWAQERPACRRNSSGPRTAFFSDAICAVVKQAGPSFIGCAFRQVFGRIENGNLRGSSITPSCRPSIRRSHFLYTASAQHRKLLHGDLRRFLARATWAFQMLRMRSPDMSMAGGRRSPGRRNRPDTAAPRRKPCRPAGGSSPRNRSKRGASP